MGRAEDIIKAYEDWDPDQESATDLASRLGISKARLYQVLEKEGISPKARRPREGTLASREVAYLRVEAERTMLDEITERGVRSLLDELKALREEVAEYRKRYGPLE